MILRVDPDSRIPVYRQIVDGIRVALVKGKLTPNQQLPGVRRLALDLGVHFNTVAQAYRELAEEGWLVLKARSGVTVRERVESTIADSRGDALFARRVEELAAEAQSNGIPRRRLLEQLRRVMKQLEGRE